ncbi:MAG: tyrosine-type recombinase/integrase [Acidobacteriota bacterium]|nr:tyrosine-type recombinase/integrase [Acidobacteriota bacterium]
MKVETALLTVDGRDAHPLIRSAAQLWAESTTDQTLERRADLIHDKSKVVISFFAHSRVEPWEVGPPDVKAWQAEMEGRGITASTIYLRTSFLSSFFRWAMANTPLGEQLTVNPVALARPRKPKPYRTARTKALLDDELRSLVAFVRAKAAGAGNVVEKRDYALLQWYVKTGRRRSEVISLRGSDVQVREVARGGAKEEVLIVRYRIKGGRYLACELRDPVVRAALFDYLEASGRRGVLNSERPLWTRHDRAGRPGAPLTSHAFVKNLKRYAREAGLDHIHNHMTRHTFARMVSEETGSLLETQEALDHEDQATTRVYVESVSIKRDKFSERISKRIDE